MHDPLEDWKQLATGTDASGPLRDVILRSWGRSERAGLARDPGRLDVPRVSPAELRRRTTVNGLLVELVADHLEWLEEALSAVPHVAYFVDRDGIVLVSKGTDRDMMEQYGLTPGSDWSERSMGTNGAGTCLATGRPVTVFGAEHFLTPLSGFVCSAAPVRDPEGQVLGALDLSTSAGDGRPHLLMLVAHVALAVQREYALHRSRRAPEPAEPRLSPS